MVHISVDFFDGETDIDNDDGRRRGVELLLPGGVTALSDVSILNIEPTIA